MAMTRLRIGQGFDVHAFGPGDHVMLGGVRIPHKQGVEAHSDGDVLLHALCDALLGALALGDIGRHFPPGDPAWRGADSMRLLDDVMKLVRAAGWQVINADLTLLAEAPRIAPHVEAMRARIASGLGVTSEVVSVKATTTEKLGSIGRAEGLAASAVVLLGAAE